MSNRSVQVVIGRVKELAKRYPENKYQSPNNGPCYYTEGKNSHCVTPGCIFGVAIADTYPELRKELEEWDEHSSPGIAALFHLLKFNPTQKEQFWADRMQYNQDSGKPWGECIDEVENIPSS